MPSFYKLPRNDHQSEYRNGRLKFPASPNTFLTIFRFGYCSNYTTRANELQKRIEFESKKGRDTLLLRENLCNAYIKEKNVEKVKELTEKWTFGDSVYCNIINMHIDIGNTEHALSQFNEIRAIRPNFKLNRSDTARLLHAMFRDEREWSDIIRIINENKQQAIQSSGSSTKEMILFLQTVVSTKKPEELGELYEVLVANNFLVKDSGVAGLMVKVHLKNKDLPSAVKTFEKQFDEKKFTSNHVPLMAALITANDMDGLQKIFKCMQLKYSNGVAVLALATSLISTGNIQQARIVLKHDAHITDHHFRKHCERSFKYKEYSFLEKLLTATIGLDFDCTIIYSCLLSHYCAEKQTDKALDLWRRQRDHNQKPSREFLHGLRWYLTNNDIDVPFPVPEREAPLVPPYECNEGVAETESALRNGDVDAALEHWRKVNTNSTKYISLTSKLVQSLSNNKVAVDVAIKSIVSNRRIVDDVLHGLIKRLAKDGETELLERLGDLLPSSTKRSIQYGMELLKAYEKTNKWDEYLNLALEKKIANENINYRLPMEDLLKLLQNHIMPLEKCECSRDVKMSCVIESHARSDYNENCGSSTRRSVCCIGSRD